MTLLGMSVVPGLGHYMIQRRGRAFLYPLLFFGSIFLGVVIGLATGREDPVIAFGFFATCIWGINMFDMMIHLLVRPTPRAAFPPPPEGGYAGGGAPYGPAGDYGMQPYPQGRTYIPASDPERRNIVERFYTILLSTVPGLAHFQLGLMQRGLTLLLGFFGLAGIILFISAEASRYFVIFLVLLPIIWMYGLFDAMRQLERKQLGEPLQDRSILEDWESERAGGRRSRLLATLLSVMPGAGHMYLGAQRRGVQLMGAFLLAFYLLDALQVPLFMFVVPIIWCYSFFDALQLGARYERMEGLIEDVPLIPGLTAGRRWLGAGMILLAGYIVFRQFLYTWIVEIFGSQAIWVRELPRYVQLGLIALLLLAGGVKLLLDKGTDRRMTGL